MVEESKASAGLSLRLITEYDSIFAEQAYQESSIQEMAISGEDVATEFKQSGLFDSELSDVSLLFSKMKMWLLILSCFLQIWQEVNQTGSSFLTRAQFIMACLLVYEQANNTTLEEKESVLAEIIKASGLP